MNKKRNDKESKVYLTPKPSKNNFRNIWKFFIYTSKFSFLNKRAFKAKGWGQWRHEENTKRGLFNSFC